MLSSVFLYVFFLEILSADPIHTSQHSDQMSPLSEAKSHETEWKLFQQGIYYHKQGFDVLARNVFEELCRSSNTEIASKALNNLGNMYLKQGMLADAIGSYEKATHESPNYAMAYNNLGIALEMKGDIEMESFSLATMHFLKAYQLQHESALLNLQRCVHKYDVVPQWHFGMLNDQERNKKFENAIVNSVSQIPNALVLDIGTGSGLLAMMAARAGAKKVIACERVEAIATVCKEIVKRNGFENQISIISKESMQLKLGEDIPRSANIVLAEIVDSGLLGEGILISLNHAFKSGLVQENAIVIPQSAIVFAQIIDSTILRNIPVSADILGFDLSLFNIFFVSHQNYEVVHMEGTNFIGISDVVEIFHFDFKQLSQQETIQGEKTIPFPILQKGNYHNLGILFWFELHLNKENSVSCSPYDDNNGCHWGQALQCMHPIESASEYASDSMIISINSTEIILKAVYTQGKIAFQWLP